MENKNTIYVERETFEKNEKTYFSYFIRGILRGRNVKVALCPPDKGGYAVLDLVFGDENKAKLVVKPFEIKEEATGKIIKGNTYTVQVADQNGTIYECSVKPARSSDKSLLNMLLN